MKEKYHWAVDCTRDDRSVWTHNWCRREACPNSSSLISSRRKLRTVCRLWRSWAVMWGLMISIRYRGGMALRTRTRREAWTRTNIILIWWSREIEYWRIGSLHGFLDILRIRCQYQPKGKIKRLWTWWKHRIWKPWRICIKKVIRLKVESKFHRLRSTSTQYQLKWCFPENWTKRIHQEIKAQITDQRGWVTLNQVFENRR